MDCSQSPSETSASVRRAGEPAAVSGEPVSKGYVQSRSSQSLLLFQKDADGTSPTGSTLNQACSHASGFIMVQSDHTYAGPSTEASASSLEPGTAGVAATLSASADLSPGAPFSSSPLSCEGSFTSPINERRPLQKLRAKLRQLRNRNKRLQGLLLQRRRMKTTAELKQAWIDFVRAAGRHYWTPSKYTVLCARYTLTTAATNATCHTSPDSAFEQNVS
ncbi:uncharacterized protein LOC144112848 isoform X2 [Amblyomma americanum]